MPSTPVIDTHSPLDRSPLIEEGQIVAHYKIEGKVGEGGMGVVYRALDLRLNRPVALKFLHPRLTNSCEQVASLEKEATAISTLNHPNIATIYGIEEAHECKFIVLEYLPRGTLKSLIGELKARGRLVPLVEAVGYGIQIAEGLAHAHEHGIIHRDIKSSNILFTAQGTIKIVDFSLASSSHDPDTGSSLSIAGTPSSMSPEQAQGKDVDHRSDIFSLGIVLFELLTGKMPFGAGRAAAVLQQITSTPAPPLSASRPGIPTALESIVAKALQKDREMRYQRMTVLTADLRSVQKQLNDQTEDAAPTETVTLTPSTSRRWKIRKKGIVALLVAGSLLAAVLGTYQREWVRGIAMTIIHSSLLPDEKRLVVLSFANSSKSPDELCDGLMDVISSKLTEMEQFHGSLLVISPSEVRKAAVHTPSEAREAFGATLAITVTVRRLGGRLEIMVNLVDTETSAQLRSFTIETDFPEPVALQDQIVARASQMLDISLAPGDFLALQAGNTHVPSAYRYYVEGRGYLQRFDKTEYLDKAMFAFRKATQLDPRYALAYSGLAAAWLERFNSTKDPQAVSRAFENALLAAGFNDGIAEVHVTLGRAFSAKGQFADAEREFQRALQIDPVNAEALRRLARTYQNMNRRNDAERIYRKAIQLRPIDWRGYQSLGNYYFNNGNQPEAARCYQRVLDLTPGNYNAYNDLGAAYLRMGNYAQAAVQLNRSVALKPIAMNYSNLGSVYYLQGRFGEAAQLYQKAVVAESANSSYWGNLADAYRWTPELALKAPEAYRKAVFYGQRELSGNLPNSHLRSRVAYYYAATGDKDLAMREMADALRHAPHDGYVLFRAALVYEQLHNRAAALDALHGALLAGYPPEEIRKSPVLESLRADAKYMSLFDPKRN
jgi:serine/threonine protein kinase/Flp pilus assembly protein TadD